MLSFEPPHCSMSSSNWCFLTCIQVSQESGKVVWYSHLLKNSPQSVVIHTVKGFCVINEADVLLDFPFSVIQQMLAVWSLVPLPFLHQAYTSGSSWFTYRWSLALRILSITWLACEMNAVVQWLEHSLALPVFGVEMKTDLFLSCGHCQVFPSCWHIECSTLTASSFRIWHISAGILSPP